MRDNSDLKTCETPFIEYRVQKQSLYLVLCKSMHEEAEALI